MKKGMTSAIMLSAVLAMGGSLLASAPAQATGTKFHWKGGHGYHGSYKRHHFGFYAPILVGGGYGHGIGCYFVKKVVFVPGFGYVKKPVKICKGYY